MRSIRLIIGVLIVFQSAVVFANCRGYAMLKQRARGNAPEQQAGLPRSRRAQEVALPPGTKVVESNDEISFFIPQPAGTYDRINFRFEDEEAIRPTRSSVAANVVPPGARELTDKQTLVYATDSDGGIKASTLSWFALQPAGDFRVRRFTGVEGQSLVRSDERSPTGPVNSGERAKDRRTQDELEVFTLAADAIDRFGAAYPNAQQVWTKAYEDAKVASPRGGMVGHALLANSIAMVRLPETDHRQWIMRAYGQGKVNIPTITGMLRGDIAVPLTSTPDTQDLHSFARSLAQLRKIKLGSEADTVAEGLIAQFKK